jgi:uncharacterized membrane protein YheB (UPF0754 family)
MKSDAIGVYLKLNPVTDSDIIKKLEGKKKQTYIKQLIRDDIRKSGKLKRENNKRLFDYVLTEAENNDKL